jgi:hypothetical protein
MGSLSNMFDISNCLTDNPEGPAALSSPSFVILKASLFFVVRSLLNFMCLGSAIIAVKTSSQLSGIGEFSLGRLANGACEWLAIFVFYLI